MGGRNAGKKGGDMGVDLNLARALNRRAEFDHGVRQVMRRRIAGEHCPSESDHPEYSEDENPAGVSLYHA